MSFMLSPGVQVREIDLTTVVPGVATSEAAIAGAFRWGPVNKPVLVSNENELVRHFGRPTNLNGETFFTAANFLSYSRSLYVSRAARTEGDFESETADLTADSTTLTLTTENLNVVAGMAVFGPGIEEGTEIVSADTPGLVYTLSKAATADQTAVALQFFDANLALNAIANTNVAPLISHIVPSQDEFETAKESFDMDVQFITRYPGAIGNSLDVSVCETATAFHQEIDLTTFQAANVTSVDMVISANENTATLTAGPGLDGDGSATEAALTSALAELSVGDYIRVVGDVGEEYLKIANINPVVRVQQDDGTGGEEDSGESTAVIEFDQRLSSPTDITTTTIERFWEFFNLVEGAPGRSIYQTERGSAVDDELHVVVVDRRGEVSNVPGTVVEIFEGLSRATDARGIDGEALYFKDIINQSSQYVWAAGELPNSASNTALNLTASTATVPYARSFVGGRDTPNESNIALADLYNAYLEGFENVEEIDISLVLTGKARGGPHGEQLLNFLIDNLAHKRKDCVVFGSPDRNDVVGVTSPAVAVDRVTQFRNSVRSSSYGVLDSGYKYTYDKYNDVYRWVPLNGDTAGLCAHTDEVRDAWWSPAGFNRGHIRNIVRLSWNPNQSHRDALYKNGINPVVSFPGQGTVLYGDKTLLAKPSAFDRINVRRLFIVLQKAISEASKFSLFEFNDEFTRASFVNLVTPFLRDVQGRRGITDFRVVCDESNNTGEVIDRNEFIGDIYIKPARSINFIRLNFVAVRTGVEFSEVVGQF